MKKTIKEELEEKYLRAVLIDDNHLLIYTENEFDENKVDVSIRRVVSKSIEENYITSMTKEEFKTKKDLILEMNKDKTALAVYKIDNDNIQMLDRIYLLDVDSMATPSFLDCFYGKYFPENELSMQWVKKKEKDKWQTLKLKD